MASISEQTRNAVWGTLCDLEWNKRYYAAMADKYKRNHLTIRFSILSGIVAEGFILYFAREHEWVFALGLALALVLAVGTVWDALSDYAQKAANLQTAEFMCDSVLQEVEDLWRTIAMGRIETEDAESALQAIKRRWTVSTERARVRMDQRINDKAYDEANEDIRSRSMRFSDSGPRQAPGPERPPRPQPSPPPPTSPPRESEPNRPSANSPRPTRR